jgi:short-subunit dehydrogenase
MKTHFPISPLRLMVATVSLALSLLLQGCATTKIAHHDGKKIAGKTYVVTGAASGLGKGVALELGRHRANVVLAGREAEPLDAVAVRIAANGGTPLVVVTDVAEADQVQNLAARTVEKFGHIDVWINNAGVGAIGRFEEIPLKDHSRVVDVNLKGVIYGSHAALRQFRQQRNGVLLNIGSIESEIPLALHASYAATKGAVLNLGRALNEEIRMSPHNRNVQVVTVMPWAVDTPFFEHAANYTGRTARMALPDSPEKVVAAIVRASLHPKEEVAVGWKAKAAYASHRIAPDFSERLSAIVVKKQQLDLAAPGPESAGALHSPANVVTTVDGKLRERMSKEDADRKEGKVASYAERSEQRTSDRSGDQ